MFLPSLLLSRMMKWMKAQFEGESAYRMPHPAVLQDIRRTAKKFFADARGSHDWDHTLRVLKLCRRIGLRENADMEVLLIAAYLHDIGRSRQDNSNGALCHAEAGAQLAEPTVSQLKIAETRKGNILHCIRSHRFRGTTVPQSVEARVLFDADKLDAIGAVGVARAFLFAGEVGARLHNPDVDIEGTRSYSVDDTGYREYMLKLSKIKERMLTVTGREIASERHAFMENFFEQFVAEYEGKR
jgi:uncharacterized protein